MTWARRRERIKEGMSSRQMTLLEPSCRRVLTSRNRVGLSRLLEMERTSGSRRRR